MKPKELRCILNSIFVPGFSWTNVHGNAYRVISPKKIRVTFSDGEVDEDPLDKRVFIDDLMYYLERDYNYPTHAKHIMSLVNEHYYPYRVKSIKLTLEIKQL